MHSPRRLTASLFTALALMASGVLTPTGPASAEAGPNDHIEAPTICTGGDDARQVPRFETRKARFASIAMDTVCVPDMTICASDLITVGPPLDILELAGSDPVSYIVCSSEALGYEAVENHYVRYVIERRFRPNGQLEDVTYVTETVNGENEIVYLRCNVERFVTSVAELAFIPSFTQADGDALRLYQAFFNRKPDLAGARFWTGQNGQRMGLERIAAFFATSQEFEIRYGTITSDEFLTILYRNVLGRDFDQEGYDFWLEELTSQRRDRANVVAWFARSPEFRVKQPYPSPKRPDNFELWTDADERRSVSCLTANNM